MSPSVGPLGGVFCQTGAARQALSGPLTLSHIGIRFLLTRDTIEPYKYTHKLDTSID